MNVENMNISADIDTYDLGVTAEAAAEKVNCRVVIPAPNQLQIDIDSEEAYRLFFVRLMEFERHSGYSIYKEERPSKAGLPHRHVTLTVYEVDGRTPHIFNDYERIALQAVLGSDLVRETLNMWRLLRGEKNPSRLFEPKDEANPNLPEAIANTEVRDTR